MPQIVYTDVADVARVQGQLFEGIKFWLSQKVPSRSRFVKEVEANGGEVTQLEKAANVKIVDHARKEKLPDTYSYRYIELSIRNGILEDLEQHAVGPPSGTVRTSGSTVHPPKSGRTKFTKEDDDFVKRWVVEARRQGGQISGNEIYKQLEAKNSRHTWQSWRDRWVKHLQYQPRSDDILRNPPPTPPADDVPESKPPRSVIRKSAGSKSFTRDDLEALISVGGDIMNVLPENVEDSWSKWVESREHPEHHTAQEWQNLWEGSLREIYLKRAGAAPDDSLVSNNASQQSSSTSYDNEPRQPAMVSLPTRPSPMKREASDRTPLRSPSYHPLSPSQRLESTASNGSNGITQDPIGDPVLGSMQEDLFIKTSPKRKRETSEDVVEVPSSSPPGSERPPKRFRRDFSGSQHSDVAPVPEQIVPRSLPREIPDTYPTTIPEGAEVVDLLDAEDSSVYSDEQGEDNEEEYQVEHEEEYEESEEDYKEGDEDEVSRCLSPELGLSSSPPSMDRGRVVSETQAAFQGPTPSIEYELPPPEGGWDDEDEDQEKEGPEIFEIGSDSDENEEEEGDENKEEEGDENEDVGGDELEDEAPKDEVLDQPRAEPRIEVKEDDDGDELEDEAEDNGEEEESEVHTSIPTAQPTTQAIFDAETQFPDLSLPEPEGGWDSVLPSSPSPSQLLSDENIQSQIDMQIFAESQRSSLPPSAPPPQSPPQETTAAMPSPPPPPPSSASKTKAKAPRQKKALTLHSAAEFDECLARNLALGYKEHDILSALKCTSMDPELTRRALGSMAENGGAVEVGMKGFWTEEDDGDLECRDARRVKRVEAKHGTEGVERRWEWLREYRA